MGHQATRYTCTVSENSWSGARLCCDIILIRTAVCSLPHQLQIAVLTFYFIILYFQSLSTVFFHPLSIFTRSRSTRKYRKYYIMFIPSTFENHTWYTVQRSIECPTRSTITSDEADDLDNLVRISRSLDACFVLHVKNSIFFLLKLITVKSSIVWYLVSMLLSSIQ